VFEPIEYREWMAGRPAAALHGLASTDLRGGRENGGAVPGPVAGLEEPPAGVTLHTLLATEYGVEPEQVVLAAGTAHANFLAVAAALTAGDGERVLVEEPGHEPLVRTPRALGATVDRFTRPDDRLAPGPVADALGDATELAVVTNRHNPTGRLASRDGLAAVADRTRAHGAWLLVDEAYAPYETEPSGEGLFDSVTAAGLEGAAVTGSLTEFAGLGELRIGWLVADRELAGAARRVKHHVPAVADTSAALAGRAIYADGVAAPSRELLAENRSLLEEFVDARPDIAGEVHTSFAFLDPPVGGDRLVEAAAEEGLLVVPGRFFGDPGRVRVSLARDPADGAVALETLGAVLDRLR